MVDSLIQFIQVELLRGKTQLPITADDNLLAHGMIDSLGIVQLLAFIEKDFGVKVPPEDVTIQNFRTVNTIMNYLKQHSSCADNHGVTTANVSPIHRSTR